MKNKMRTCLAALLTGILFAIVQAGPVCGAAFCTSVSGSEKEIGGGEEEITLHAQSAVLLDMETGRVLYEKNGDQIRPMASTTKIMTCILALEQGNLKEWITVSDRAAAMPDVQMNIRSGERYRLGDLLHSLMLESHNDSAVVVAEGVGGSVENFAEMMNQKARDIGCGDTCFVTPNGLDAEEENGSIHSTTARDLARIMRYCVSQSPRRKEFLEITRAASRTIWDEKKQRSFYLANHNALLTLLPQALSGKTGFTGKAGYCYVAALGEDGKEFAVALLGCGWPPHKTWKWEDMKVLSRYAFSQYERYEIFEKGKVFAPVPVENGIEDQVEISLGVPEKQQTLTPLLRRGEQPEIRYEYPGCLTAPVRSGQPVGRVIYSLSGETIAEYPIVTSRDVDAISLPWCLSRCLEEFIK